MYENELKSKSDMLIIRNGPDDSPYRASPEGGKKVYDGKDFFGIKSTSFSASVGSNILPSFVPWISLL